MKTNCHVGIFVVLLISSLALMIGCAPVQINGGGTMPSTSGNPSDKANLGFWANSCTPDPEGGFIVNGTFNYHDKMAPGYNGGVKINGTITDAANCTEGVQGSGLGAACTACNAYYEFSPNSYAVTFNFRSTNPRYPGTGNGIACIIDNGQGKALKDQVALILWGDQYNGYYNQGNLQGNVSTYSCPSLE